jgi:transcriptional regulator with XRE-family HTH domain
MYPILASRRRSRGLSQQEVAARAGIRREKLNRVESKNEDIGLEDFCRLLDALGLELSIREKAKSGPSPVEQGDRQIESAPFAHRLVPQEFHRASFIDGSKAKILSWGKVPK